MFSCVAVCDGIYFIGGRVKEGLSWIIQDKVSKVNIPTMSWTSEFAPMQKCRHLPSAAVSGGFLYVLGGRGGFHGYQIIEEVEKINLETHEWSMESNMQEARTRFGVVVLEDTIYSIGGYDDDGDELTTFEMLLPHTQSWTTLPSLPVGIAPCTAVAVQQKIVAFGPSHMDPTGAQVDCRAVIDVYAFDLETSLWARLSDGSLRLAMKIKLEAVAIADQVYVFGGGAEAARIDVRTGVMMPYDTFANANLEFYGAGLFV